MLAQVGENASLLTFLLESPESALEGLALLHPDTGHENIAPFPWVILCRICPTELAIRAKVDKTIGV
jgi:hypothetical protein